MGGGDLGPHSTLGSSNTKGTLTTRSSENSSESACSEQVLWNAEEPNVTAPQNKLGRTERTGENTDLKSTSQDQEVKTVLGSRIPAKTLAAAGLVWSADVTELRASESNTTGVDTLTVMESTRTSSGNSSCPVSVSGEKRHRSPTPTDSESLRESSSQSVTDARCGDADGSRLATESSSISRSYHLDTTSVPDDGGTSPSQDVQQQPSSGERSASHSQDYMCVICSDHCDDDHIFVERPWTNAMVGWLERLKITTGVIWCLILPRTILHRHPRYLLCRSPKQQSSLIPGQSSSNPQPRRSHVTIENHTRGEAKLQPSWIGSLRT